MMHRPINPAELGAPKGYSNGMLTPPGGRLLFVAGQVAWNDKQEIVSDDFAQQFGRAIANVAAVVRAAGGQPSDVARLTLYVTDKREYASRLAEVGAAYRAVMGKHFPAMSLIEVKGLLETGAKLEIEATAVLP